LFHVWPAGRTQHSPTPPRGARLLQVRPAFLFALPPGTPSTTPSVFHRARPLPQTPMGAI